MFRAELSISYQEAMRRVGVPSRPTPDELAVAARSMDIVHIEDLIGQLNAILRERR